jgi:serine/threonine protein phosphatase PrpC
VCSCCCHQFVLLQFSLQPGDVVIMATDGLWDNLWDEQV